MQTQLSRLLKPAAAAFALAAAAMFGTQQAQAQQQIDFEISDGKVVPSEEYAARVTILGAAITSGGTDVPVTVQVRVGDTIINPFGSHDDPTEGDINDGQRARHYIVDTMLDADTGIDVTATSWVGGSVHLSHNSHDESTAVKVLRNNDPLPDIAGFDGQDDVLSFIAQYIDTEAGVVRLHKNQAIYLFEIGTSNLTSSAADFQDAVVLVTLGDSIETLENFDLLGAMYD